jgi:hypothetical protein
MPRRAWMASKCHERGKYYFGRGGGGFSFSNQNIDRSEYIDILNLFLVQGATICFYLLKKTWENK